MKNHIKKICLLLVLLFAVPMVANAQNDESKSKEQQPAVIKAVAPWYPHIAVVAKAEGKVEVKVTVNSKGEVAEAKAKGGFKLLQTVSELVAKKWLFESAKDGVKERTVTLIFVFRLVSDTKLEEVVFKPPYEVELTYYPPEIVTN